MNGQKGLRTLTINMHAVTWDANYVPRPRDDRWRLFGHPPARVRMTMCAHGCGPVDSLVHATHWNLKATHSMHDKVFTSNAAPPCAGCAQRESA